MFVALDLSNGLIDGSISLAELKRKCLQWVGEPVKAVSIHTNSFFISDRPTKKGMTRLRLHTSIIEVLKILFPFDIHVMVRGTLLPGTNLAMYCRLVEKLCHTSHPREDHAQGLFSQFSHPFRDSLQTPLHPLSDNLDSDTYRVMEEDPVKYESYESALCQALLVMKKSNRCIGGPVVVLVVGAGRGPLVQAALNASVIASVAVKVVAVDKNFNAVVTMRNRFDRLQSVSVVWSDMRDLKRSHPSLEADVIVSELLGSWGDNELSPECLEAVETSGLLKQGGVMIPNSYESFLAPVTTHPLWVQAKEMTFSASNGNTRQIGLDSPYVVHLHNHRILAEAKPVFKVFSTLKNIYNNYIVCSSDASRIFP